MNNDTLAQDIMAEYGDSALFAELAIYRIKNGQVVRETITIDFIGEDYQYQTNSKPIYTE